MAYRVAIVHDWLFGMRGGEKVLEAICEIFPGATLFTLFHVKGSTSDVIERMDIRTSFIQSLPLLKRNYRLYLPLFPMAIERLDLDGYDLVVSSSHCVAKGVRPQKGALHLSYVHAPMRYIWDRRSDYFAADRAGAATRAGAALFLNYLRRWDVASSSRVDYFAANSHYIAGEIKNIYKRDAVVIYPPVDVERFAHADDVNGDYYIIVSALAPYKRIDIAIEAFKKLGPGYKLKIIGSGQDEARLKRRADGPGGNVEFLGWQPDDSVVEYLAKAKALIFPGVEDFGITPVEAMASGRPVIAFGKGGVTETVTPLGRGPGFGPATGVFFDSQTPEALVGAIKLFESSVRKFDPTAIRQSAQKFASRIFVERFGAFVEEKRALHGRKVRRA
jgi:glycosyltransferase involved in cell wall biosynthesis